MFRFEDPAYLYLLVLVPILALIRFYSYRNQKKRLRKFGDPDLLKELMPDVSRWRPSVKFWLLEAALTLMIVMLARPQMGTRISHEKRTGIETIIAMDISNSMLAEDVVPSRLERSKMMVENLVDNFTNDKIGLIVFAGDAFVQLPITSDYVSAKMFLSSIDPSMIQTQGTDIATAISMATHSFTPEENIGKAIIIITDGEDHEGGATEAAEEAKKLGMRVYVLGVGSVKGSPIPVPGTGDYMRDNTGEVVMSALNEQMCREVAQAGGGAYIHVENNSSAQRQLDEELDLLLLLIEICIFDRKNPLLKNLSLFGNKKQVTALLVLMFALSASAQDARQYIRNGNKLYRAGDYVKAEVAYSKAVAKDSLNPQAAYNLGNALMMQQKDSSAIVQYQKAARLEKNPLRLSQSFHNIGVICQKKQLFAEAIEAYKQSLRLNPNDDETRYNLVLCQRQQKQQQQNQKQQGQDKDDKQDQQKQEKQQQQQDKKQQKPQEQKPQMSKENAEQLLQDAMRQEQQTQKRLKEAQQQPQRRQLQKNW